MDELLDVIGRPDLPPLIVVTGPAGIGRTTLLTKVREDLAARGLHTTAMRFSPDSDAIPGYLPDRWSDHRDSPWPVAKPVTGAFEDPVLARFTAAGMATTLLAAERPVLLIDDAQWMDRDDIAVLEQLAHRLAGTAVSCVCAVRVPAIARDGDLRRAAIRRLRRDGLVHTIRLRGLRRDEVAAELASMLRHVPDAALVDHVRRGSRGIPAALHDSVETLRQAGAIRFSAGHAYLAGDGESTGPMGYRRLTTAMLELGPDSWTAAKAVAVLYPLGAALPRLLAEALACTETEAAGRIALLRQAGVLHRGLAGTSWRFPIPLVATALVGSLGPYEKQHLARIAVTALWSGAAHCADPDYLADQVAAAGRLVDPAPARTTLLARAQAALSDRPDRARRWLRAAADLAVGIEQYASLAFRQVLAGYLAGDADGCLDEAASLLEHCPEQLPPGAVQVLQLMVVFARYAKGDFETLRQIAERREDRPLGPPPGPVPRATALSLLDRWAEARSLLTRTAETWHGNEISALFGGCLHSLAEFWGGRTKELEPTTRLGDGPLSRTAGPHRTQLVDAYAAGLLATGDLSGTEKLLTGSDVPAEKLSLSGRALLAAMRGRAGQAIELCRRCVATVPLRGGDPGRAAMLLEVTELLVAQGKPTTARELLASGRAAGPPPAHLLDCAEALIDHALGEPDDAISLLRQALASAAANDLLVGTDLCWSLLTELSLANGDQDTAARCLVEIDRVAEAMPTGRAATHALLIRARVTGDLAAAEACLRLVRERGQPFELARSISRLVDGGLGDPALLAEAYELFGGDALLERAWLRNLMRAHDVPVPGRRETLAENERLLGLLVSEGLSNKEIARMLRTSRKSVEGRLNRLFTRTGLTSRIELARTLLGEARSTE
ncbi:AAA family ATPase [Amycolatopsis sp. cmx-4-54]|uniref:AAA family ATPase n=1 Tax=Amycolatopsis sp. cmx-4-54 TaxID=2790936 RepID=UPI003978289D